MGAVLAPGRVRAAGAAVALARPALARPCTQDREILAEVANGTTHRVIAHRRGMKTTAVSMRISRMFLRRALTGAPALVAAAVREGWIVWNGDAWAPAAQGGRR